MLTEIKSLLKRNWIFYLAGFLLILGLKYFYSNACADELKWILTPTAWWVRTLSGISFEWESSYGYVNHSLRFVIAPSCSGVQFMLISFAVLLFSFVHRTNSKKAGMIWIVSSLLLSYVFTILVNGLRIVISIYLPVYLSKIGAFQGWLTPERLHTLIGTVVYFSALLLIYYLTGTFFKRKLSCFAAPLFWYLFIVLVIPFLNNAYRNNRTDFLSYTALILPVCIIITTMISVLHILFRTKIFKRLLQNRCL